MSIASVTHGHVLGIKKNVKENLFFADESTIIYPAGNNLIVSNIEQKSQRVVPVVAGPETITALALAPDRHIFAVGEKGERPSITVYDLPNFRKRRTLMATGDGSQISKSFTSIAFSYDSKYVAAQMGGPEWLLHFYSWEKGKLVAVECTYTATTIKRVESSDSSGKSDQQQQGGILQIGINPEDGTEISVLTESALNLYKYSEGTLRPKNIPIRLKVFSCHSWLTGERLAIGTRDSYVLIVDRRGTVGEIAVDFSRTTPHSNSFLHPNLIHTRSNVSEISTHSMSEIHDIGASTLARTEVCVTSLVPTSRAIIVGGNAGMVCVYEHSIPTQGDPVELHESHDVSIVVRAPSVSGSSAYRLAKRLFLPSDDPIPEVQALAVSASEGHVVIGLTTSQIFLGTLSSTQSAPTTNLAMPTGGGGVKGQPTDLQEQKCEPVSQPYHHGAITGLGTCCRRPLMISCSADRSIRIWNYMTGVCELVKYFPEEPHSVSLHPSGLYVLAGFSDKLRLMNLLIDDLRLFREFSVRGCRECKFSNGGHMFAAVHGNMIQLYSTWTFETIANLKGHNGKVRSLYWSPDDSVLVSAGQDGAVYTWNVMEFKRENEYILKGCSYTSAVCTPNGRVVYAVGSDRLLKEISDSTVTSEAEANTVLTQLAISQSGRMMFAGTSYGAIRSLRFPPVAVNDHEHQEHIAHSGAVTKFCISSDDGFLFSGSEDGCLLIFKISAREDRKRERSQVFADEILITRSDLEEKTVVMTELKRTLEELKLEHEYQLRLKDMNYNEKIKEITEKCSQEIEALKISTSVLRSEKDREEVKQQDELMQMRTNFAQELHVIETFSMLLNVANYLNLREGCGSEIQPRTDARI
ncbi:WD40-repeat-containing domain protein [Cladochytrium replicatum]|nr:WD40-repeat-containing domain protein [Cladochytrium replicatum]